MNCGACKHFIPPLKGQYVPVPDEMLFGDCERIKQGNALGEQFDLEDNWSPLDELDAEIARLAREEKAAAVDGSGYMASLRVKPDFGCVLWETK